MADVSFHLAAFHEGDRPTLERCYREHCQAVMTAAARILPRVDAETVTHEVFHRLLSSAEMRQSFHGGDLRAWLSRIAHHQAIDHQRRYAREEALSPDVTATTTHEETDRISARMVVERFRRERLPAKWEAVFETRFMKQLGQREAARELGMNRTTLMYQEHQIRALLRRFVLEEDT